MDYNSRKTGTGSTLVSSTTDSPRDPSKSGRLAATALGRTSKEYSHSGDAGRRSASKPESAPRISKDHVVKPKPVINPPKPKVHVDRNSSTENVLGRPSGEKMLQRLKDDRERDILNQSLKRTKVGEDSSKAQQHSRERDILNQSLKRTKVLEDSKPRLKDERGRDILHESLKRAKVTGGEDVKLHRLKDERENPNLKRTQIKGPEVTPPRPKGEAYKTTLLDIQSIV